MPVEAVDDVRAGLDEGRFEHVREERQDGVERRELGCAHFLVLHAAQELGEDGQVEDEGSGEERILEKRGNGVSDG